jgi:hypothetical protein
MMIKCIFAFLVCVFFIGAAITTVMDLSPKFSVACLNLALSSALVVFWMG